MRGTKELNSKNNKEKTIYVGAGPVSAHTAKTRQNKGITLIALIITIIVMLILVGVTIAIAVNGGLFSYAGRAGRETQDAINAEQKLADGKIKIGEVWYDSIDAYLADSPSSQTTTIVSEAGNKILITKNYNSSTNPETLQLKAKLHVEAEDMEADKVGAQVTWASSNEEVATVNNNGLVTALTEGTTEITAVAVYNGVTYPTQEAFVVTVAKTGLIAWVDEETLTVGDKTNIHLKLNVEGTEITTIGVQDATWTAAPDGKVTIDKTKEEITAVASGETEITVSLTYGEKTYTDNCTVIVTEKNYVGYYADINDDGTVDGVIYADLAFDANGTWSSTNSSTFSYTASNNLKNYAISTKTYAGQTTAGTYTANGFGEKSVLVPNGETGNDRFYVMALEDFTDGTNTSFCWYDAAYGNMSDYETATSTAFGTGKTNTTAMIAKWNAGTDGYGTQNTRDLWGVIQNSENYDIVESVNDSKKWFVPSKAEWSAFGSNLGITSSNYRQYGLGYSYWSSSQYDSRRAWSASFYSGSMDIDIVYYKNYVRLNATF